MNLTRFAETPLEEVWGAIEAEAARQGTRIASAELIGLIPRRAFELWPAFFQRAANFDESRIIETRIIQIRRRQLLHSE